MHQRAAGVVQSGFAVADRAVQDVDPVNEAANLAVVTTVSAVVMIVTQPIAGLLSDQHPAVRA